MTHITVITEFLCGTVNRGVTEGTKVLIQVIWQYCIISLLHTSTLSCCKQSLRSLYETSMQYIRSGIREVYDVLCVISTDMDHRRCHTSRMLDDLMWWKLRGTEQQSGRDCSWVFLFCTFLRVEQHQPLSMWAPCSRTPTHEAWSGRPVRWTITQMNWRTTKRRKTTWKPKPVHPAPVRRLVPPLVPPQETTPAPTRVEGTSCSTWASASSPGLGRQQIQACFVRY